MTTDRESSVATVWGINTAALILSMLSSEVISEKGKYTMRLAMKLSTVMSNSESFRSYAAIHANTFTVIKPGTIRTTKIRASANDGSSTAKFLSTSSLVPSLWVQVEAPVGGLHLRLLSSLVYHLEPEGILSARSLLISFFHRP